MIGMLIIQSYWDLRYKEIPLIVTIMGGVVGMVLAMLERRGIWDMMLALIPGIVCLVIGKVTRQAVGYGDGLLLCAMGMYRSCETILSIIMTACLFAGVVALILLVLQRKRGKDQLPFVPFLLVASVINMLSEKGLWL